MTFEFKIIDESEVKQHISVQDIIDRVDLTYQWYSEGRVVAPAKITTDLKEMGIASWINAMPSYIAPCDTLGIKWAGGFSDNKSTDQPYIKSVIVITNSRSGKTEVIIEGDWISDMRTGAQTAVAAKYLAVSDPKIVSFIGAGAQSYATALCLSHTFNLNEIRIFDIDKIACNNFVQKSRDTINVEIVVSNSIENAVLESDIIVTATGANCVLVREKWVKKGALVSSIGSYQELEDELIYKADKLIVDNLEQNIHRGEFAQLFERGMINPENIHAEIGDIITMKKAGRSNNEEIIIISPIGMGSLDISIAGQLIERIKSEDK
jgi:alanine dehydrogenase